MLNAEREIGVVEDDILEDRDLGWCTSVKKIPRYRVVGRRKTFYENSESCRTERPKDLDCSKSDQLLLVSKYFLDGQSTIYPY